MLLPRVPICSISSERQRVMASPLINALLVQSFQIFFKLMLLSRNKKPLSKLCLEGGCRHKRRVVYASKSQLYRRKHSGSFHIRQFASLCSSPVDVAGRTFCHGAHIVSSSIRVVFVTFCCPVTCRRLAYIVLFCINKYHCEHSWYVFLSA